jgi:tetratricopeptide (TPR) repeat protein
VNRLLPCLPAILSLCLSACVVAPAAPPAGEVPPASDVSAQARTHAAEGHRLAEGGQVAEALAELDRALALDPKEPVALRDRAILRNAAGRPAEALVDIDLAAQLRPEDVRVIGARCVIRVAAERSDAGLSDCQRALALQGGGSSNAYTSLGQAQLSLGRYDEAIAGFNEALKLAPNHMRALYGRGLARQAAGDAAGQGDMTEALRRLPGAGREFHVPRSS